jgi:hypothetical protein
MKIVVDCFSKPDTILSMSNNTHTYKVTEILPPGRFLDLGEPILKGDLSLENDRPAQDTGHHVGQRLQVQGFIYRPDPVAPPVAKQRHDGLKCQEGYRFLNADEVVKKDDETRCTKNCVFDWHKVDLSIGETIQDKDQYWDTSQNKWVDTWCQGELVKPTSDKYRRKVEVPIAKPVEPVEPVEPAVNPNLAPNGVDLGQGYRLVLESERIQDGDETWSKYHGTWDKCGGHSFGFLKSKWPGETIRRKVEEVKDEIKGDTDNSSTARWVYEKLKDLLGIEENNVYVNVERLVNENKALKEKLAKVLDIFKI